MINFKKLFLNFTISLFFISFISNVSIAKEIDVSKYILEPMPSWYNERYYNPHLDINLMIKDGFTRYEALEIQNQMKDILDNDKEFLEMEENSRLNDYKIEKVISSLNQAIKNVKENRKFENNFKPEKNLKNYEFYVVFDMDETLLVQWYKMGEKGSKYYTSKVSQNCLDNIIKPKIEGPNYFLMIPKWEEAFDKIYKIPGNKGIILFSAKLDIATHCIIDKLKIKGKPLKDHVKAIFTRNYLIREVEPTKLSKDLRMIDETLEHVIIIDDNPTRILEKQKRNLRKFPKYNADEYLLSKDKNNQKVKKYFENLLDVIVDEIQESAEYARKNNVSFVEAYFPYSDDGSDELIMLQKQGMTLNQAVDFIRNNRKIFEPEFYVPAEHKK
ncbi:MAG: hypothetical protein KatS3mg068_1729 [Candidatus Sericytochromatia bacterium]|nr:MAG: hypothetical protein KatS3mg068_1729 [Candidatus Sericytochromatia bacterium]